MPKKKQSDETKPKVNNPNVMGLHAAVVEQPSPIRWSSTTCPMP